MGNVRVIFGISAFEIGVGDQARPAVSRACDVDGVEVLGFDDAVEVNVDEVEAWSGAPMSEESGFDVFEFEGFFE